MQPRPETAAAALLVLTANRGLCGGYNASVLRLAYARCERTAAERARVAAGGLRQARHLGLPLPQDPARRAFTHFEDKPGFAEVDVLANRYLEAYRPGQLDRLDVAYTKFESLSRQQAVVETLLPLAALEGRRGGDSRRARAHTSSSPRPRAFSTRSCRPASR